MSAKLTSQRRISPHEGQEGGSIGSASAAASFGWRNGSASPGEGVDSCRQRSQIGNPGLLLVVAICFSLSAQAAEEPSRGKRDLDFFLLQQVLPHIAVGGGWTTTLTFVDVGEQAGTFPLKFYLPDGSPWVVSPTGMGPSSEFTITLAPGRFVEVELPDNSPNITTGWAEIQQPRDLSGGGTDIGGQAIFTDTSPTQPNRPDFEAVVPLSSFADSAFFLPFDNTGGLVTCAAFANPSELITNTVTLDYRDENDNSL